MKTLIGTVGSLLGFVLIVVSVTGAQQAPGAWSSPEVRGYLLAGGSLLDVDRLNERLAAAGHPQLRDGVFTMGGGGHVLLGRVLLGGEGHGVLGSSRSAPATEFDSRLSGGYGLLNFGGGVPHRIDPLAGRRTFFWTSPAWEHWCISGEIRYGGRRQGRRQQPRE